MKFLDKGNPIHACLDRRAFTRSLLLLAATPLIGAPAFGATKESEMQNRDAKELAESQATFAYRLLEAMTAPEGGTITVSPMTAAGALALIAQGANTQLKASIGKVLQLSNGSRAIEVLGRHTLNLPDGPLTAASALMVDPAIKPKADAVDRVRKMGAEFFEVAFDSPDTVATVNGWVAKTTRELIPQLFETIPQTAGLIALNALHFKDRWQKPFDPAQTQITPFHLVGGGTEETQMMRSEVDYFGFRRDKRFIAVTLPFATPQYELLVVTSTEGALALADFADAREWLSGQDFQPSRGEVRLPRLKLSASMDIKPALNQLGLIDTGLTGFSKEPLQISAAQQRVEMTVNEEGAEAAAATGITVSRSMDGPAMIEFVADRPFVFALRNVNTGMIAVAGYVAKP